MLSGIVLVRKYKPGLVCVCGAKAALQTQNKLKTSRSTFSGRQPRLSPAYRVRRFEPDVERCMREVVTLWSLLGGGLLMIQAHYL